MLLARFLAVVFLSPLYFLTLNSKAGQLPDDEIEALKEIGKTLKKEWDFTVNPCDGVNGWRTDNLENSVMCDNCNNITSICHVTNIVLKGQSLPGSLPPEIVRLPFLRELDLSRNYLSGPIPPQWGSTKLLTISLLGNRLTGRIPNAIGNISTLTELVLEMNHLSGTIPQELGNLNNLSRLLLTSNNFSGELPPSLARITTLADFRISDNQFIGPIPKFIQNWKNLSKVAIQASGLIGPIPSEIGLLTKLVDVRISDLNGGSSPFPPLNTLTKLEVIILRSCNITGMLPVNLPTTLETLDFSFNKITGPIPRNFEALKEVDHMWFHLRTN